MAYEETLKSRIFLADRFEKMEKALVNLKLVSKDTTYCSDLEFARFKEEMDCEEVQRQFLEQLANDQEDIWFDLYRSITSHKEMAEAIVEKQVQKA